MIYSVVTAKEAQTTNIRAKNTKLNERSSGEDVTAGMFWQRGNRGDVLAKGQLRGCSGKGATAGDVPAKAQQHKSYSKMSKNTLHQKNKRIKRRENDENERHCILQ